MESLSSSVSLAAGTKVPSSKIQVVSGLGTASKNSHSFSVSQSLQYCVFCSCSGTLPSQTQRYLPFFKDHFLRPKDTIFQITYIISKNIFPNIQPLFFVFSAEFAGGIINLNNFSLAVTILLFRQILTNRESRLLYKK